MQIVGVDPGTHGALAVLSGAGAILAIHKRPWSQRHGYDHEALASILTTIRGAGEAVAFIEEPQLPRCPGGSGKGALTIGYGWGAFESIAIVLGIQCHTVPVATWQRAILGPRPKVGYQPGPKDAVWAWADKRFGVALARLSTWSYSHREGALDALAIAEYGRTICIGN